MRRVVLASGNTGKLRELVALLAPLGLQVEPQAALGVADADEPFDTFLENALAKARHACRLSGLPALADDSGLCVDALGGRPGVLSARWALRSPGARRVRARRTTAAGTGVGTQASGTRPPALAADAANNAQLVADLAGCAGRAAHYYCVLVLLRAADDPQPLVADASWHGEVIDAPRGGGGFGYDPHFLLPELGCTAAELDAQRKSLIGHRGQALRALVERLRRERLV
ncbi:MAG: non-canonical purine NTP pyrophosphatase [Burkholderiaceae bacterium]|nr:non-canonical purine NTP pyrophosphatase [Burkholderiaceae bacterium]MEB2350915.1 non-canonical purine NTP pyrophosphatase [Burkholderiaceae bacterium]